VHQIDACVNFAAGGGKRTLFLGCDARFRSVTAWGARERDLTPEAVVDEDDLLGDSGQAPCRATETRHRASRPVNASSPSTERDGKLLPGEVNPAIAEMRRERAARPPQTNAGASRWSTGRSRSLLLQPSRSSASVMSGDTAARPFRTRDSAGREQPSSLGDSQADGPDALEADRLAGMGGWVMALISVWIGGKPRKPSKEGCASTA